MVAKGSSTSAIKVSLTPQISPASGLSHPWSSKCSGRTPCTPRRGKEVEEPEGTAQGPVLGPRTRALCRQARVCLPAPVLSGLIIGNCSWEDWSLPMGAGGGGFSFSCLSRAIRSQAPERWSHLASFPLKKPRTGEEG